MKYKRYTLNPSLLASGFRCGYCGKDLLGSLDDFLTITRDHLIPRSAGGPDATENRVVCCAACDRLKADQRVADIAAAQALVAEERRRRESWFHRIRESVRG